MLKYQLGTIVHIIALIDSAKESETGHVITFGNDCTVMPVGIVTCNHSSHESDDRGSG